jgi:hypothetical protein
MSKFLHKFFADPLVGLLALGALVIVILLARSQFIESREKRRFQEEQERRRRAMAEREAMNG